jgi:maltooligosyltrehalose trehalohydrolase
VKRIHGMPFGAQIATDGQTHFRLWAPNARTVSLKTVDASGSKAQHLMHRAAHAAAEGWYEANIPAPAGTRYTYRIDDELDVPDPASRFNPAGVHADSLVLDPRSFDWGDDDWRGHDWHELVIYELHVGTFTAQGTYAALADRLDDLAELGITAIELLPLASFGGARGWGYDGVLPYAPHPAYGTPEDLKRLVQRAHGVGLSVLLDVVYNHFGPDGNYLGRYASDFFTSKHHTPWGDAIDFGKTTVRQFFIQNALYWVNEYHLDGLRVDAVHAMYDDGPKHFIDEMIDAVKDGPGRERPVHIVLENHHNEAKRLQRKGVSQWNDDFHHALHVLVTGETEGYYQDYAAQPLEQLGKALAQGFIYQGERSIVEGELRGEPSGHLPSSAFVNFLQNHDQIGNRALGERLASLTQPEPLRAALAILLLTPPIPMLFMGEEYSATQPFFYFCDYTGELAAAVRNGRREEFAGFAAFSDEQRREQIPDPNESATFERSQLVWEERGNPQHRPWWEYVSSLLRLRAARIVPLIPEVQPGRSEYAVDGDLLSVRWPVTGNRGLQLVANLGVNPAKLNQSVEGSLLFSTSESSSGAQQISAPENIAPWEVRVYVRE